MTNILAVANLNSSDGNPENDVVNTFAISRVAGGLPGVPGALTLAIANFYNGISGAQANPLANWISTHITRLAAGCAISLYDITGHEDGEPHGSPFFTDFFTMAAANGSALNLPSEVAVVAQLRTFGRALEPVEVADNADPIGPDDADSTRDRPMQRATGRIYLGPLNHATLDTLVPGRVGPTFADAVAESCVRLDTALRAADGGPWFWGVWSRKRQLVQAIGSVKVDNAFDTQRRRGLESTVSVVRSMPAL